MDILQLSNLNSNQSPESEETNQDGRTALTVRVMSRENLDVPAGVWNILENAINESLDDRGGTLLTSAGRLEGPASRHTLVDLYEGIRTIGSLEVDLYDIVYVLSCLYWPAVAMIGLILSAASHKEEPLNPWMN